MSATAPSAKQAPSAAWPLIAPLMTISFAALFGVTAALVPFVKINAILLAAVVAGGFALHMALRTPRLVTWLYALISGVGGVLAMWILWFGLEHGFAELLSLAKLGPLALWRTIEVLANTTSVSVGSGSGPSSTVGPGMIRLIWAGETGLVALAPLAGAIFAKPAKSQVI